MTGSAQHIVIVAGEASGDAHAGRMMQAFKQQHPDVKVSGIGGPALKEAGVEIFTDFSELAVMGLVEVLKRYRTIKGIFNALVKRLKDEQPDLLILVDYPGFNLKLAKVAHKLGIRVLYYISPKVWAWRPGRIKSIKRYVDHIAVLFPFEQILYENAGIDVTCVGHPLVDAVSSSLSQEAAKTALGLDPEHRVIGLFPGSRKSEVDALLPTMLAAAEKIKHRHFDVQFICPIAPGLDESYLKSFIAPTHLEVKLVAGDFYDITQSCDAIVAASGTVTLEIALMGVPHFIVYRVAPMSYRILKRLVKIPYVGLCNIVTGEDVVLELLQDEVTPERIDEELTQRITHPDTKSKAQQVQQAVLAALGPSGGAANAAKVIAQQLALTND